MFAMSATRISPTKKSKLASVITAAITSCFLACTNKGSAPPERTQLAPPPEAVTADLRLSELDNGGCLNLEKLPFAMATWPESTVIRESTRDFTMAPRNVDEKEIRRNFTLIAAFSQFSFAERSVHEQIARLGRIKQDQCQSLEVANDGEGVLRFAVEPLGDGRILHLKRLSGDTPDGLEIELTAKSPREIELMTLRSLMDPCPPWLLTRVKTVQTLRWGSTAEMKTARAEISRAYLKKLSAAVPALPHALLKAAIEETEDTLKVESTDLKALSLLSLDSGVQRCPFVGKNPEGTPPAQPTPGSDGD